MATNSVCVDDYIPAGQTDNTPAFNTAIATGKKVTLSNRTYYVNGLNLISGTTLEGVGPSSIIQAVPGSGPSPINIFNRSNVVVRDMTISGTGSGPNGGVVYVGNSGNVLFERLSINGVPSGATGIAITNGADAANHTSTRVRDCTIDGTNGSNCIKVDTSSYVVISGCRLYGAIWGVELYGNSAFANIGLVLSNNEISQGSGGIYVHADIRSFGGLTQLYSDAPQNKGVVITGNTIDRMSSFGILAASWEVAISNNVVRDIGTGSLSEFMNTAIIVLGRQIEITGNSIYNAGGVGIDLGGSVYVTVANNTIQRVNCYGIELNASGYTTCTGNSIIDAMRSNNTAFAGRGGSTPTAGIVVSRDRGVRNGGTIWGHTDGNGQSAFINTITGNTVAAPTTSGYQQYGILISNSASGSSGDVIYTTVVGNSCQGAGSVKDIANQGSGNIVASNVGTV